MKPDPKYTMDPQGLNSDAHARRFRNQATGIGQTRAASEATGADRSQRVIDCAPPAQLPVADRGYPPPSPLWSNDQNCFLDRVTGLPVQENARFSPARLK